VDTLGIVLAGGLGRRLGLGIPKALARARGVPLIERALASAGAVCERVVVAAPPDLALPVSDALRVADASGGQGPLAGCVGAFRAFEHGRAIVLGVDFPLVDATLLVELLAGLDRSSAVVPAPGGRLQPLVAAYRSDATAFLVRRFEEGERSISAAVLALGARVLDDDALEALPGGVAAFLNVNTSADLERAERSLA
jgi:molybdopterin-guanine dinucleotide biosynthesis protein A